MKKTMILILAIGMVFSLGLILMERQRIGNLESEARTTRERIAELEKQNQGLDVRLRMVSKMNAELEGKLAAVEKEKAEVKKKLRNSERRLKEIQGQVEAMTPDDMVQETRRILRDVGVEKIEVGARFYLSAFRKNTGCLKEWEEFSLVKIPALEEKDRIQENQIFNLQNQVLLWKETDRLWRSKSAVWLEERTTMNNLIINYEKQLRSQKRQRIWAFILGALAGLGGATVFGK